METCLMAEQTRNLSSNHNRGKASFFPRPVSRTALGLTQSPIRMVTERFLRVKAAEHFLVVPRLRNIGHYISTSKLTFMACPGTTLLYSCKFSSAGWETFMSLVWFWTAIWQANYVSCGLSQFLRFLTACPCAFRTKTATTCIFGQSIAI